MAISAHRLGGLRVRVNGDVEFAAKHFETANVIAMFMREQDAIELFGIHPALLKAQNDLARAQATIDQNFAMIGGDERAVSGTAAPEHRQTEHAGI